MVDPADERRYAWRMIRAARRAHAAGTAGAMAKSRAEVADLLDEAMEAGALARFGADTAIATTGVAGPGGGTEQKPVGTVWFCVMLAGDGQDGEGVTLTRCLRIPGERFDVRERSTTVALHLLRQALTD